MHKEILTEEQVKLLPLLGKFSRDFGLVGGTAIALHLGHRRSIDFDMFANKPFGNAVIRNRIKVSHNIEKVFKDEKDQFAFFINGVQFTFFNFPYKLKYAEKFENYLVFPDLLTLAAMKAFALGQRNKWKDYVDLYFIIKDHYSVNEISEKGKQVFGNEFNGKIFRNQLAYFDDMNYAEEVEFLPGFQVDKETVKNRLVDFSLL